MNQSDFDELLNLCITGAISADQHQKLQRLLKAVPRARKLFRERMDLETSLRTWAMEPRPAAHGPVAHTPTETSTTTAPSPSMPGPSRGLVRNLRRMAVLTAASIALIVLSWWLSRPNGDPSPGRVEASDPAQDKPLEHVCTLRNQNGCVWTSPTRLTTGSRLTRGGLSLAAGVAELEFNSGTTLLLQGPCTVYVSAANAARLTAGHVVVRVGELSNGFLLTTPDAAILDEGTEYAVALDDTATEVHVFDGAVRWEPTAPEASGRNERIAAGQARRYLRSQPLRGGTRIPLRQRMFIQRIEMDRLRNAARDLVSYDGFENLAGRVRRGRSGFGWADGWRPAHPRRRRTGDILDAPEDVVFGIPRAGHRLLRLSMGITMQRDLARPQPLEPGLGLLHESLFPVSARPPDDRTVPPGFTRLRRHDPVAPFAP